MGDGAGDEKAPVAALGYCRGDKCKQGVVGATLRTLYRTRCIRGSALLCDMPQRTASKQSLSTTVSIGMKFLCIWESAYHGGSRGEAVIGKGRCHNVKGRSSIPSFQQRQQFRDFNEAPRPLYSSLTLPMIAMVIKKLILHPCTKRSGIAPGASLF